MLESLNPAMVTRKEHALGGRHIIVRFPNQFGASIVQFSGSYGGEDGLWELAVIKYASEGPDDWGLCYTTPITADVLGWLTEEQVLETCHRIAALDFAYPAGRNIPERG
jgi:hypothetical protein